MMMWQCQCVLFSLISLLLLTSHFDIVDGHCFTGIIESTESGDISILDRNNLVEEDCGPTPIPSTQGPTTTEAPTTKATTAPTTMATTMAPTTEAITTALTTEATTAAPTTVLTTTPPPPPTKQQENEPGLLRRDAPPTTTTKAPATTAAPAPATTAAPAVSCAYFKFFTDPVLKENGTWQANFSCMADCKSGDNVTLNGKQGKLQCCNEDSCNNLGQFMKKENVKFQPVPSCYVGNSSLENGVKVKQCQDGESYFCYNLTSTNDGGNETTMYSCSDKAIDGICINNSLAAIDGKCTSIPGKNPEVNDTVCCCPWGDCNYHKSGPPPTHPPVTVGPAPSTHGLGKGVIAGLVFMGFFIGFVAGCCLTCYCFKRNKRPQEGVDFNYTRITADSTEDAEY